MSELKEKFIQIYRENIHREGADKLLDWLCSPASDFFTAPASTRFHGAYEGGLCEHSINVYECLCDYLARQRIKEVYGLAPSAETVAFDDYGEDRHNSTLLVDPSTRAQYAGYVAALLGVSAQYKAAL